MSEGVVGQASLVTVNETNEFETPEESILTPVAETAERKNFIDDEEVKKWVQENVAVILPSIRSDWTTIRAEWQDVNKMIAMEMSEKAKYKGESEIYLPTFINALETRTAHVKKASFPTDSYMDVLALKEETPEDVAQRDANKAWMKHQIEGKAKLRSNFGSFVRNVLAYGFGVLKVYWEDCLKQQKKGKYANDKIASVLNGKKKTYSGSCKVKTVNNFSFYAYPLSVDTLDQCTIVFEDIQISKQFALNMIAKGYWKEEDIHYGASSSESESERQQNLNDNTKTSQTAISSGLAGDLGQYLEVSEVWFSMVLPKKYYDADTIAAGDHVDPVPMKAIISAGYIIDIQENPFNHGKHPYIAKKLTNTPDVLVTPGYGKWVMKSQFMANDVANQVNDNGMYGLNPVIVRDPTKMAGHSLSQTISPGAIFDGEKDCIEFLRPDVNGIQWGVQLLDRAVSTVNDTIAPPILQGTSQSGGAANTATGAQLLQSNTKTDIQDFNEDIEQEVLIPLVEMFHSLGQQFETEEMFLAITGKDKIKFSPEMLAMDLSWQWVASTQNINQQVRGQQMQMFLQSILNPSVLASFQQQGKVLNIEPIIRKMWEDGLGQRSFESLFVKPMMGMPGAPMPGAPMPGMPPPNGQPQQVSAVDNNPMGANPLQPAAPGEGEEFRNIRNGAEAMSGPMGILGNAPKQ